MKNQRRTGHYKRKAPKGAYSNRYGPRNSRPDAAAPDAVAGPPSSALGPMLYGMPLYGLPKITLIRNLEPIRR